ncbi:MAG TPA: hypothetical protein VF271_08260 [Rhodanobacteraceae bacterium]
MKWRYLPAELQRTAATPDASTLHAMQRGAERAGWPAVSQALSRYPLTLEQESLLPQLPSP